MSDIDRKRMIPLHIADQAVAACEAEIQKLREENARLRKAGDAMASSIQFNEEMAKDYNGPTIVHQSVQRWNAAKEGKTDA